MGSNDNYQFGRTRPLGNMSFGDQTYSDQFVRTDTQPLGTARKRTAALQVTGDLVERMIDQADDQLRTCRIIVDKFSQRLRILQWAEEVARAADIAETPPEPEPAAPPRKGLFGLKKPGRATPPKPGSGAAGPKRPGLGLGGLKKPGGPGAKADKTPKPKTSVQLGGQEQVLGLAISKAIGRDQETKRRVQIAVYQYQVAMQAVVEGENALSELRHMAPQTAFEKLEILDVAKIQGKIYPICNFHEVFKRDPDITRLFPPPAQAGGTGVPTGLA